MKKTGIRMLIWALICSVALAATAVTAHADEIVPDRYEIAYYAGESDFSLYIDKEGKLYSSGNNGSGQLGRGNAGTEARIVPAQILDGVKEVKTGREGFALALKTDGTVYAWGNNRYGQLGNGAGFSSEAAYNATPAKVELPEKIKSVAAGARNSFALTENGDVYSWGSNQHGQLGTGGETGRQEVEGTPVKLARENFGGEAVEEIACTEYTAFARTASGSVYSWGRNQHGQLGSGNEDVAYKAVTPQKTALENVTKISARSTTAMALAGGEVYAWGQNNFYQLGIGEADGMQYSASPVKVDKFYSPKGEEESVAAADILCGGITNFVISAEGDVYSFGSGGDGKSGFPLSSLGESAPVSLNNVLRPVRITFYEPRSIYDITENNKTEFQGSLPVDTATPAQVKITAGIGSSGDRTFCLDENGKMWSWGNNKNGLTASGDITNCTVPVRATLYRNSNYDKTVEQKNYLLKPAIALIIIFGLGAAGLIYLEIKKQIGRKRALAEQK